MNEENNGTVVEETANQETGTTVETPKTEEIEIQEGGKLKRFIKGAVKVVVSLAVGFVGGLLFGKATRSDDEGDESEDAESEGPKDE